MENNSEKIEQQKERSFAHINLRAFITVLVILVVMIAASALLSLFVRQGHFDRDAEGRIVDVNSFTYGAVKGIAFWRVLTAPFRVFVSDDALTIIMISLFLLIMSGVFNIVDKTGGVREVIRRTKRKFEGKRNVVLALMVLIFMAFGSFFGMFEELVALLPLVIVLALSLGFDTMTGLCMCMMAACFGFSSAITNPFSVGLASEIFGVQAVNGMGMRVILFAVIYALVCGFLFIHVRRITKNPECSPTYLLDKSKLGAEDVEGESNGKVFRVFCIFFAVQLVVLLLAASISAISSYTIPILSVSFLVGGIAAGLVIEHKAGKVFKWFLNGAVSMLPAIVLIALASSVKLIMTESEIIDTLLHYVINALMGKGEFATIVLIYALVLFLQIFIGSASAKIMLIMPLLFEICGVLGVSPNLVILTYCMADGFTDVILPTNPVLLIGLSMAGVSYGKWFRFTWWFQLLVFAVTLLMLYIGVLVGY